MYSNKYNLSELQCYELNWFQIHMYRFLMRTFRLLCIIDSLMVCLVQTLQCLNVPTRLNNVYITLVQIAVSTCTACKSRALKKKMTVVSLLLFGLTSCFCATAGQVITIQPILPANGPACPEQDVKYNCTVTSSNNNTQSLTLAWMYRGFIIVYNSDGSKSGLDNDIFTAVFFSSNNAIISTAIITNIPLSHHDSTMQCLTTEANSHLETIKIAGAANPPSNLSITGTPQSALLTWLPPPNAPTDCIFNYTVNITSSDSTIMTMHSSTTSLMLTDLTQGQSYSFSVAVTDSTVQHGLWSEQLMVEYNVSLLPAIVTTKTYQDSSTADLAGNKVYTSGSSVQLYSLCCSQTPEQGLMDESCLVIVTASTLASGVLSAVVATIITSVIACCVMKRTRRKTVRDDRVKGFTNELDSAIYDVPVVKEQSLSIQDNIAYGGKMKNNNTYEEIR